MSRLYPVRGLSVLVGLVCLVGCEAAKSANPTAPSVAGPIPGVNITAPRALEPFAGQKVTYTGEPQTLLIENAGTNGARTITLEIDVATDPAFTQLVHHADTVALGEGGRTVYRLPQALPAGYTYYWRTKANDGANSGPYSEATTFLVVPPAVIGAPRAVSPSGKLSTIQPDFRVTNGAISGTTGVAYRFEVSRTADFNQIVAVVTVTANGSGTTTMTMGALPYEQTFYWRVKGSDGTAESEYSNTVAFTTADRPQQAPNPTTGPGTDTSSWTTAQWEAYVMDLARRVGGPVVSDAGMRAMRGDLLAHGSDFQNGWRGDMRPRIFLPVPGCPIANRPDVPACSYNRTVDLGNYGGAWQWIPRF
ncbi:MAG TPA: hypothetical protein VM096_02395 [Vicinamibacterales bacterium]|nr:hypothetical protein [Vicinamibacterales bacterium]